MDVSIIILTRDAGDNFRPLLERIYSQKFDGMYEVLVIDSGSTDETVGIARTFPARVVSIQPDEFHHGRTRNLGAELSEGNALVYITQDALPLSDDWLQTLVGSLSDRDVAMVCGRQIARTSTKPPERFFYVHYFPEHRLKVTPGAPDYYRDNVFISNVNSAIRRDVWRQFRFSETIDLAEDKEFARRILSAGWSIAYEPGAAVSHSHDLNLHALYRLHTRFGMALTRGAGGLPRSRNRLARRLEYYAGEMRYVAGNESRWKWLPYTACYEVCKVCGIAVGMIRGRLFRC